MLFKPISLKISSVFLLIFFVVPVAFSQTIIFPTPSVYEKEINKKFIISKGAYYNIQEIEFLDDKGNVDSRIDADEKISGENETRTEIRKQPFGLFLIKTETVRNTKDVYRTTGLINKVTYVNKVYDFDGQLVFEQTDVPYRIETCSGNQKIFICATPRPPNVGGGDDESGYYTDVQPPAESEIYVFSVDGKLLHEESSADPNVFGRVSPSGRWLAFSPDGTSTVKIIDLQTGSSYLASKIENVAAFCGITDDGP
jgi:hypothetical protein